MTMRDYDPVDSEGQWEREEDIPGFADDDMPPERFYVALRNALTQLRSAPPVTPA